MKPAVGNWLVKLDRFVNDPTQLIKGVTMDLGLIPSEQEWRAIFKNITWLLKRYSKLSELERSQVDCALECVKCNEQVAHYIITQRFIKKKSYNQLAFELYYDESNIRKIRNIGYKHFAESYKGGALIDRCSNERGTT